MILGTYVLPGNLSIHSPVNNIIGCSLFYTVGCPFGVIVKLLCLRLSFVLSFHSSPSSTIHHTPVLRSDAEDPAWLNEVRISWGDKEWGEGYWNGTCVIGTFACVVSQCIIMHRSGGTGILTF